MEICRNLDGHKVLFGQDVHGPLDPSFFSNREHYRQSLQLMLDLNADILCEGHLGVYEGAKRVKSFIQSYYNHLDKTTWPSNIREH